MKRANEKGGALILALILILVLSIIAVSLTFLSQTETWSSMNYRLMSQARYGAESGLNKALNHLIYTYAPPGTVGDPLTGYNMNVSPVTSGGNPVILSANSSQSSNYPISSIQSAFHTAAKGTLTNGHGGSMNYAAYATLLSMRQVNVYGSTTPVTVQTWQITSDGTISGVRNAQVEVSAIVERQVTPAQSYALFATSHGCGAITFTGNANINSYDSTNIQMSGGSVVTQQSGGNVGTNGNLTESGNTHIYGSLSTPRTGVGNCNNGAPDAWTSSGQASVSGGLIQLPQPITYPTPDAPNPLPPTTNTGITKNNGCAGLLHCSVSGNAIILTPGSFGNLSLTGGATMHLTAGTYAINSIKLSGNSAIVIDSGPVIFNVAGTSVATPVDLTGGSLTNSTLIPTNFQIFYAGSGNITITGGSQAAGLVYAPNASVKSAGGTDWFGAVVANTITDTGGTSFHYDRHLQTSFYTVGNYMVNSFTWKKY
jgi:Tfp pilus assembly protein PilX